MSTDPSYLRTAQDGRVRNLRDWGIPLGRRFRALKLWFLIRQYGVEGLQERIRRDIANADWLRGQIDADPEWERLAPAPFQTLCVRHVPTDLAGDEQALRTHNLALVDRVNLRGRCYLTPAILKGTQIVRISIGAQATGREHVAELWRELSEAAYSGPR
jgi:aromatic-L-amino-acid/L-tryptophan decarboxylase